MKTWWISKIVKVMAVVAVAALVLGFVVMLLWNALVPELFGGPTLTYWQAIGLLILSHLLFSGGPGRFGGRAGDHWKKKLQERMESMTPEERERFKAGWARRCGTVPDGVNAASPKESTMQV